MTPRQLQLLDYVRSYIAAHGHSPTFEEMRGAMGYANRSSIARVTGQLVERGYLIPARSRARGVTLPGQTLAMVPTTVLAAELARRARGGEHG